MNVESSPKADRALRRVAVTGMGVVSPIGTGIPPFWESLSRGKQGIRKITRFDPGELASQMAGEIQGFDAAKYLPERDVVRTDRFIHYALVAAKEAIASAALDVERQAERVGVAIGTGGGGSTWLLEMHDRMQKEGVRAVSAYTLPAALPNMAAGWVSLRAGAKGPLYSPSTACAAGAQAIGEAFDAIQSERADVMLAGGTEAPIHPLMIASFSALRALSVRNDDPSHASRPFDANRDGFVLAEGAGVLVLEALESALARDAHIYAELVGYAMTADATHPTNPTMEGPARAMELALKAGGILRDEVDYINAHGTSTLRNDANETAAIKTVFGDHAHRLMVSSTKSMTGHLMGAAGAVEAIATILSIERDLAPPTINYEVPDSDCDLDYVPNHARSGTINVAISNSFAFGGTNVTLALRKHRA
jgi:3-oxoacyl-[acyl-carrier-protein] synthase II